MGKFTHGRGIGEKRIALDKEGSEKLSGNWAEICENEEMFSQYLVENVLDPRAFSVAEEGEIIEKLRKDKRFNRSQH